MVNKRLLAALATSFVIIPVVNLTVSASEILDESTFELHDIQMEEDSDIKNETNDEIITDDDMGNEESNINYEENTNIEKQLTGTDLISNEQKVVEEQKMLNSLESKETQTQNLSQNSYEELRNISSDQIHIELGGLELDGDFSWQAPSKSKIKIESVTNHPSNLKETYDTLIQVDYYYSGKKDLHHFADFYIESDKCNWTKYDENTLVWIYKLEKGNQPLLADADFFYLNHVGGILKNNRLTFKFYTNVTKLTYDDLFKPYGMVATGSYECPIQNDGTLFFSDVKKRYMVLRISSKSL